MKLSNVVWKDFILRHGRQLCAWVGSEGPDCKQYLLPVRLPQEAEIDPTAWQIRPSQNNRPILQANENNGPGLIFKVSAQGKLGKVYGRIWLARGAENLTVLSFGVAANAEGTQRWEESILILKTDETPTELVVNTTSGEEVRYWVDLEGFSVLPSTATLPKLVHIHDPALERWMCPSKKKVETYVQG